jgi:HEAT repeat protein
MTAKDLDGLLEDLTSGDDARAEPASVQLAAMPEVSLPALRQLTSDAGVESRWWALQTLAQFEQPDPAWFIPLLDDPAEEIRAAAALALWHHPTSACVGRLSQSLDDRSSMVTTLAANALIAVGPEAVPVLLDKLQNGSPQAKIQAARALAEVRDPRSIPALLDSLENGSAVVKHWAGQGLDNMGLGMVYFKLD